MLADTMAAIKQLGICWLQARCPRMFTLQVYNALIRARLTYSIEGAHMDPACNRRSIALHRHQR